MNNLLKYEFDFGNGIKFSIGGDNNGAGVLYHEIIIDRDDFYAVMKNVLNESEIESVVKSCRYGDALTYAKFIVRGSISLDRRGGNLDEEILLAQGYLNQMEEFLETEDQTIIEAYNSILDSLNIMIKKKNGRKSSKEHRKEVNKDYNNLFVKIGRRDGFHCQMCKSTFDLQIDHVFPLSKGGNNDTENLQLLCFPCNLKKRDSV